LSFAFWSCDYSKTSSVNDTQLFMLQHFPTKACWDSSNGPLAAVSMIVMVVQIVLTSISTFIYTNTCLKSRDFFLLNHPFLMVFQTISNLFYLIVSHIFPHSLAYVPPSAYVIISILIVVYLFWHWPFIRKSANILYGGFGCARIGIGALSIVASLINEQDKWEDGLILLLAGVVGASIFCFAVGCIIAAIVITYYQRKGRNIVTEWARKRSREIEESDHYSIELFIRLAMKGSEDDISLADTFTKIAMSQRTEINGITCVTCALFVKFVLTNSSVTFALLLIQNARKRPGGFISRYLLFMRSREIETASSMGGNNFQLDSALTNVRKRITYLSQLHKSFWKTISINQGEDHKLYSLVKEIHDITKDCTQIFSNLVFNYRNNVVCSILHVVNPTQ